MNIGSLAALGKIAGIGGIALGVVALIFGKLVGAVAGVPADERAATVQLLTLCCFGIGALGLIVWFLGTRSRGAFAMSQGDDSPAINAGGNVGVNAAMPAGGATRGGAASAVPQGTARTKGNKSPAVNAGGSVAVNTDSPHAAGKRR